MICNRRHPRARRFTLAISAAQVKTGQDGADLGRASVVADGSVNGDEDQPRGDERTDDREE